MKNSFFLAMITCL